MPCPPFASRFIQPYPVQTAARVGFEGVHDPLRPSLAFDHNVNVGAAHVGRKHAPVAMRAVVEKRAQHCLTALAIHGIGLLVHISALRGDPLQIACYQAAPGQIMLPIDGTRFVAVQVAAITGKGNQVSHNHSWSRLRNFRWRMASFPWRSSGPRKRFPQHPRCPVKR